MFQADRSDELAFKEDKKFLEQMDQSRDHNTIDYDYYGDYVESTADDDSKTDDDSNIKVRPGFWSKVYDTIALPLQLMGWIAKRIPIWLWVFLAVYFVTCCIWELVMACFDCMRNVPFMNFTWLCCILCKLTDPKRTKNELLRKYQATSLGVYKDPYDSDNEADTIYTPYPMEVVLMEKLNYQLHNMLV